MMGFPPEMTTGTITGSHVLAGLLLVLVVGIWYDVQGSTAPYHLLMAWLARAQSAVGVLGMLLIDFRLSIWEF